jgi:hypothetical protein
MVKRIPCALFQVRLAIPEGVTISVHATPLLVMDGGATATVDEGGPRVVAWLNPNGDPHTDGADASFEGPGEFTPLVAISVNPESAVSVDIRTDAQVK